MVALETDKTKEYIKELQDVVLDENIDKLVLKYDDSHNSKILNYYFSIIHKYFDSSNSEELIAFSEKKKEVAENIPKEERYEFKKNMEFAQLVEFIYMKKYDRHIKKIIYNETKKKFFSGNTNYNPLQEPTFADNIRREAESYAIEGFLIGIRKYEPSSKNKLITYVTWWINQRVNFYIEKHSTINKGHKKIIKDEDMVEGFVKDDGELEFKKYANIQFENYKFVKTDDLEENNNVSQLSMKDEGYNRHDGKIYDILKFFCSHKDLFLDFEYLIIKYDILLEEYVYFIDDMKDKEIEKCFYSEINHVIEILRNKGYQELEPFEKIKRYHKLPEALMLFVNLEKSEYLSVKRILKQKLTNILKNVFLNR